MTQQPSETVAARHLTGTTDELARILDRDEAMICTRDWSAWRYKTMSDDDFEPYSIGLEIPDSGVSEILAWRDAAVEVACSDLRAEVERLRASNRDAMQTCESYRAALRTADAETVPLREEIVRLRAAILKAVAAREVLLDIDTTPALVFGMLADLRRALEG